MSISYKRTIVLACLIWVTRLNHIPVGEMGFPNGDRCLLCQVCRVKGRRGENEDLSRQVLDQREEDLPLISELGVRQV